MGEGGGPPYEVQGWQGDGGVEVQGKFSSRLVRLVSSLQSARVPRTFCASSLHKLHLEGQSKRPIATLAPGMQPQALGGVGWGEGGSEAAGAAHHPAGAPADFQVPRAQGGVGARAPTITNQCLTTSSN